MAISAARADLAYEYLIGHARWFGQPPGAALLGFLAGHLRAGRYSRPLARAAGYRPSPGR